MKRTMKKLPALVQRELKKQVKRLQDLGQYEVCPTCYREYPYGDPRAIVHPPQPCFECERKAK